MLSNKESLIVTRIRNLQSHSGQIVAEGHLTLTVSGARSAAAPA
jgi:hypothetical protein